MSTGDHFAAEFLEVRIEGKGPAKVRPPHDLEACAVDKAERPAPGRQKGANRRFMDIPVYPEDAKDRNNIPLENANGFHSDSSRQNSRRFDKDIIVSDEGASGFERLDPNPPGGRMPLVAFIEDGQKGACVDEDAHGVRPFFLRHSERLCS